MHIMIHWNECRNEYTLDDGKQLQKDNTYIKIIPVQYYHLNKDLIIV